VFSKPDFDYYHKLDSDPDKEPAEFGTFRECVLPAVEAGRADLVTRLHRLNDFIEIISAPGHSAGHVVFDLESGGQRAVFLGDVFHHLLRVYYNPSFRGDATRWSPEDLFVASVSACHKLWYLHLCASAGVVVLAYPGVAHGGLSPV
jgi:glyoxylase-like metal-dependent hydrolase (beta-lactamase superfamily II)